MIECIMLIAEHSPFIGDQGLYRSHGHMRGAWYYGTMSLD